MGKIAEIIDVSECVDMSSVLQKSKTDWDVEVARVIGKRTGMLNGRTGELDSYSGGGHQALVRPDINTALAFVGERYRSNSHRNQLQKLDCFVRQGDMLPVSVSVWDNGAILAYQFRCPGLDVCIHDRDVVSPLLTLAFSYGFRLADSAFFSDFRWFCKNQMGKVAELSAGSRVRHRGDVDAKYEVILGNRIQELSGELSTRYSTMRRMTTTPMQGTKALTAYFGECIGASPTEIDAAYITPPEDLRGTAARIPEILECYLADDAGAPGTVWQAYNAVTRHQTHKAGRTEASRQRSMLMGAGGTVAANAWQAAARMVG